MSGSIVHAGSYVGPSGDPAYVASPPLGGSVVFLTAGYSATTGDNNKYFVCSGGSWTLTLPTPQTGLVYRVRNDMGITGTVGTITLTPASGTIDGLASLALLPGQECTVFTDGTNWRSFGRQREVVIGTQDITASQASATILLPAGYRYFELDFTGLTASVDASAFVGALSSNGGSTWITAAAYNDTFIFNNTVAAVTVLSDTNVTTGWFLAQSSTAGCGGQSQVKIYPGSAAQRPSFQAQANYYYTGGTFLQELLIGGYLAQNVLINALKYSFNGANILNSFLTVKGVV